MIETVHHDKIAGYLALRHFLQEEITNVSNLLLPAGAAGVGKYPLKFQSGVPLTTPETGALEFYNNRLWITNKNLRKAIDRTSDVALETVTVENTLVETLIYTGAIPANSLVAGNVLELYLSGKIDEAAAADSVIIRVKLGGVTMASIESPGTGVSAKCWHIKGAATLREIGVSGVMAWHLDMDSAGKADDDCGVYIINTVVSQDITVTVEWGTEKVGNIFIFEQGFIKYRN
ncbi:hypothetical protein KAR91_29010 [Candidatus Pacearchaeota archaeon]|nr:hypothetical protein [Candidatus Pacearchaeota archaeon]